MSYLNLRERLSVPRYDDPALARTGRVAVNEARCNGCGNCVMICPGKALALVEGGGGRVARMAETEVPECVACGDCAAICKRGAISIASACDFGLYYRVLHRGALCPPRRF